MQYMRLATVGTYVHPNSLHHLSNIFIHGPLEMRFMRYIDELEYINTAHNSLCIKLLQLTHCRSPLHRASEKERKILQYQPESAHYHQFVVCTGPSILGWHQTMAENKRKTWSISYCHVKTKASTYLIVCCLVVYPSFIISINIEVVLSHCRSFEGGLIIVFLLAGLLPHVAPFQVHVVASWPGV